MFHTYSLYIALAVFGAGLLYKISSWFRYTIWTSGRDFSSAARVVAALRGVVFTLVSRKFFTLMKVFLLDVILQIKVLRQDFLRWASHMCIYWGFILLLLMHALDVFVTASLFPNYQPTLNPFLFLRNLFGALVVLGLALAVYRRFILKVPRLSTNAMDIYAVGILAVILFSGILLEASKMTSHTTYQEMVDQYALVDDEQLLGSLESYWVAEFGLVSPHVKGPFADATLEQGKAFHEMACRECHSRPQGAFASYAASRVLRPVAPTLDRLNMSTIFWHLHFLACLLGLAYLPFSKMFHMITAPLSLLTNAVMDGATSDPANVATRQIMELDACTHCGACSRHCAVAVAFEELSNVNILPSEKIYSIKAMVSGRKLSAQQFRSLQEGVYLCTNCYRCTVVCPVGINLQQLWFNVREALLQTGQPEPLLLSPFSLCRGLIQETMNEADYVTPISLARKAVSDGRNSGEGQDSSSPLAPGDPALLGRLNESMQANSLSYCYRCMTCSVACPVVRSRNQPQQDLGLLPHQIIHAVGLRFWELVFNSRMLWDCLGCYQCQEHCPQKVCVADVIFELKNVAVARARQKMNM